ncbi:MAG TPA: hypothetical protein VK646_14100 [Actinomycetota bacterium]|nr:hypothetical protein [Actinomycetota bacterium]
MSSSMRWIALAAVIVVVFAAWTYNEIPGIRVAPDPAERKACELQDGGLYRWDITAHDWTCSDNWLFPGVSGV